MRSSNEKVKGQIIEDLVSQEEIFRISATGSHFKRWAPKRDNETKTLRRLTRYMKWEERKRDVKETKRERKEREREKSVAQMSWTKTEAAGVKKIERMSPKGISTFVFGCFLFFKIDLFSFLVLCGHWKVIQKREN